MGSGVAQKNKNQKGGPGEKTASWGKKKYEEKKGPEDNKNY
jgi:hypothetical protein